MGVKIGLDNGTTNTVLSELKDVHRNRQGEITSCRPAAFEFDFDGTQVNSIVVVDEDGEMRFGKDARDEVGDPGVRTFKGFKMLLSEEYRGNREMLEARGYSEEYDPSCICRAFLNNVFTRYLENDAGGDGMIDALVVGVPAIWLSEKVNVPNRLELRRILSSFDYIRENEKGEKNIFLYSEPDAACAYYTYNYRLRNKGKRYEGYVFIPDCGGGTLDFTLCEVKPHGDADEIATIRRWGVGENTDREIGKAGIAFLEKVILLAFERAGIPADRASKEFNRAVYTLEKELIKRTRDVSGVFGAADGKAEAFDPFAVNPLANTRSENRYAEKVCTLRLTEEVRAEISYAMLAEAYDAVIEPVLAEILGSVKKYLRKNGIDYLKNDRFNIVPVGGFCNFCLTQKQIEEAFARDELREDERFDLFREMPKDECEKAVAYGAALIANEVVKIRQYAPYSIGIGRGDSSTTRLEDLDRYCVIHEGDEILYDQPVYIRLADGKTRAGFTITGTIPIFFWGYEDENGQIPDNQITWGRPLDRFSDQLKFDRDKIYHIGFSLDKSLVITLHIEVCDNEGKLLADQPAPIRLDDIHSILGALNIKGVEH